MSNAETKLLAPTETEAEVVVSRLLHEFRNQLGGLKLYAALLRKGLANNTLDPQEGIELCEKILHQIDTLTLRAKEAARSLKSPVKK